MDKDILTAIITTIGNIVSAIIGTKKKKEKGAEPPIIKIEEGEKSKGIINGIEIIGTAKMDEMPLDSSEYWQALATKGEMLKNGDTIFEITINKDCEEEK